jgi:transcriptional regulator with XRE-family HTH domain
MFFMKNQVTGYDGTFPRILRELLECHPITNTKTTLKGLAEAVGIRQQTVSLYRNGETQPTPETLVKIAKFFDVSVDYLLTGISSQNKPIHEELGLSEEAIRLIKIAGTVEEFETLNDLLSDSDFYHFLEDVTYKAQQVKAALDGNSDRGHIKGFNVEGYLIWDLQKFVEEFILNQLVKHGLAIEERTVKINPPESEKSKGLLL